MASKSNPMSTSSLITAKAIQCNMSNTGIGIHGHFHGVAMQSQIHSSYLHGVTFSPHDTRGYTSCVFRAYLTGEGYP